jgi:hypothetical protein
VLDEAAASESDGPLPWPRLHASVGHFELHAMRVVAARSKKGDDWGVFFEVVQGDILGEVRWPATIQQYRYGSKVPPGGNYLEDARPIGMRCVTTGDGWSGAKVTGPKGTKPVVLTEELVAELDLQPGDACSSIEHWPSVLAIRARLARDPAAFWIDPIALAKKLLQIADPVVLVASDAFEHVCGSGGGDTGKLGRLPSASPTFRSLARAIAERDPSAFVRGASNTTWRALVKKAPKRGRH